MKHALPSHRTSVSPRTTWHQPPVCFGPPCARALRPDLVEPRRMEEFMVFSTVFLGSPHYVRNAYLR